MKQTRHPHPHVDPRQPRDGSHPGTNPPVFAWKPASASAGKGNFSLTVARDEGLSDVYMGLTGLADPIHLPQKAFEPGRYFWKWAEGGRDGEVFEFEITPEAVVVEVPPAAEWLRRFPAGHPRIYTRPERLDVWRRSLENDRPQMRHDVVSTAEGLLAESHELAEPPFLPDWNIDYEKTHTLWLGILRDSRQFVKGAEMLALAYLATGEKKYSRAACSRMASISKWDPSGSSYLEHNDEAHMSVIWHGPAACDWVWDEFTDEERAAVIEQFRERGRITYEHMHDSGLYGVTLFNSHPGREIVFLAMIALVFHEHIPDAEKWLEWLRPVLCRLWPVWAGDDGGWAEGPAYGLAYVGIMTMFATALKSGASVDLYTRPFWRNHARWRKYCLPTYAEWMGFGDQTEPTAGTWLANADLIEIIARQTGTKEFAGCVEESRAQALRIAGTGRPAHVNVQTCFVPEPDVAAPAGGERGILRVFPAAGWAAIRTDVEHALDDVAFIFRSSPFGSVSHSHANNNDFIIHSGGRVMAMPSGYYVGYGSAHHTHWVWHTKSHNCVTLSDAGQIMKSYDSRGAVENAFEDDRVVYLRGTADAGYSDRAERCRRHVLFLKGANAFVLVDEFVALPQILSGVQWNIHSYGAFSVDDEKRSFLLERDGSSLEGTFLYHENAFFSLSEGWEPPPMDVEKGKRRMQYHLRFTPKNLSLRLNLGVVLCPGHASLKRASVTTERIDQTEIARIGDDVVLVGQAEPIEFEGIKSDALAVALVEGVRYDITDDGISLS